MRSETDVAAKTSDEGTSRRARRANPRRFWVGAIVLCLVLAVVSIGLAVAAVVQGPALTGATIDTRRAVALSGTRLRLQSRQPLATVSASQVTVSPATPFTISTSTSTLSVRFTDPLLYATRYTVKVSHATSRDTGVSGDWTYSFTTPPATLYTLMAYRDDAAAGTLDAVQKVTNASETPAKVTPALTASSITQFAVAGTTVVALSSPTGKAPTLVSTQATTSTASGKGDSVESIGTGAEVSMLQADSGRVGYVTDGKTASGAVFANALFVHDLSKPDGAPVQISDSYSVQDWRFVPNVAAVAVLTSTGRAYLVYLDSGTQPVPLGSFAQFIGFVPGTTVLAVMDANGEKLLDLTTGTSRTAAASMGGSVTDVPGRRTDITTDSYLMELNHIDYTAGNTLITTRLTHVVKAAMTTLASVPPSQGEVMGSGVSPNRQFAWMTVLSASAPVDDLSSGATDHQITYVYDLATGKQVAQVTGGSPTWVVG